VPLGGLAVAAASVHTVAGTAAVAIGPLSVSAPGIRTTPGTATVPLGALTVAATGTTAVIRSGTVSADLGALTVTAEGLRTVLGTATVDLGRLDVGGIGPDFYAMLFDPTGQVTTGVLSNADALQYRREVSQRGNANLHVPLDEAGGVDFGSIVKFAWRGRVRFGCLINSEETKLGVDGRKWVAFDNQPGLLSLLDQAFIEPEYGLKRTSSGDRHFGYPSADGPWRVPANWHTPIAVPWGQPGGRHFALPKGFTTADNWIARSSPNAGVSASTQNWFIGVFDLADTVDARILAAGDNFLEMYMDGEQILGIDRSNYFAWRTASEIPIRLTAGRHRWAARIENTVPVPAFAGSPNPVGFIANLRRVDKDGNVAPGPPIMQTNTSDWIVTDITPGWRKAQVLKKLIEEAQARGVPGATSLTIGWTDTHDSAGVPWADAPGEYTFSIGTVSLADVASQLGESGFNVWVDADTMTVLAYGRMGVDRSGSLTLALGEGGGVIAYDVTASSARATAMLMHLEDGSWQDATDAPGIAAVGRIETGLQLGSASTPATAAAIAAAQLADSAHPQIGVTCQVHPSQGPQLHVDYDLGDSMIVPGRRGSTMKGRQLADTVKKVDGAVQVFPEFAEDRT
jgi:hypothetical protein